MITQSLYFPTTHLNSSKRTKFWPILKSVEPMESSKYRSFAFGFGFDAKNNDHEIVLINFGFVEVYSLKTGIWRLATTIPQRGLSRFVSPFDVYANGMHSWLENRTINNKGIHDEIMSFDLNELEVVIATCLPNAINLSAHNYNEVPIVNRDHNGMAMSTASGCWVNLV
ncbi:hypothetical protein FEM48_Zijuj02G0046000 [Ziziphus jujuba var. spinosa]|uniref:F-box/kelch-repeat protein At3g06240-like n=1 Tax=Ziziphus jujuba var. spinosa TaxID=714518 RepID=A0A978VTN7_ZIZJJ|nr:hypothetical protein FEM48_Zijuj02G0046000 [Ziziphus jujuba var. spinosa]